MKVENTSWVLCLSVLCVFAFGNCMGAVDGALSKIATALQVDHTIALYVGSIPALTSMISSLLIGFLAGKRLPYKATVLACAALMVAAGVLPCVADNFAMILVTRCFFGLGLGGMMSLQNPIATTLIATDRRARVLGLGTCVAFAFQCVLQLVGGMLADIQWNYVFLTHLILVLPLVGMAVLLPSMPVEPPHEVHASSVKLPAVALAMCVVVGIVSLNLAPLLFGSAFYVAAINDSATVAAIIAMLFSIGCMVGGLAYPRVYRVLGNRCFGVFLLVGAVGLVVSARATTIVVLGAGFFIGGISFASMQAAVMMLLGLVCAPSRVAFASALMMIMLNLGGFLCSGWEMLIGTLTGDTLYAPLLVGAGVFVLMAVALLVKPPASAPTTRDA